MSRTAVFAGFLCAFGFVATSAFGAMMPGVVGDGIVDVYVDVGTPFGEVRFKTDDVLIIAYTLESATGLFTGDPANNLSWMAVDTDTAIGASGFIPFIGEHILGTVIGQENQGMTPDELAADLTFSYAIPNTQDIQLGTLIIVPEPATLLPIALGALALARQRRRGHCRI